MKKYNVRVSVGFSELVEVMANNEQEAIEIAKKDYYDGNIMSGLEENEFFDGLIGADCEGECEE